MEKYIEDNKHLIENAQEKAKNAAEAQNLVIPGNETQKKEQDKANSAMSLAASAVTAAAVSLTLF